MKVFAENKRAYFDYQVLEKLEAGIVLTGQEVKSIRLGHLNLRGSYLVPKDQEIYLIGCHIPPYQPKNTANYQPERARKLLLKKKEIDRLIGKSKEKGLTLLPLRVYIRDNFIKIEVGIAKRKKTKDKREIIKKREIDRELESSFR